MAIGTLSIDVVARLASLEADMGKASRIAEKEAQRIEKSMQRIRAVASGVGVAVGGLLSVGAFREFVTSTVDSIDALNDIKDATGASIENISALERVALSTGGTLDDVSGILVKFNSVLKEADGKNGVSLALEAIGLNAEELKKVDPAEALRRTAAALASYADDGEKARLVQELFGKSVKDAAPFLKDLAEQGQLVATVTTSQAEAAENFNKRLAAMQVGVTDLSRTIVSAMLPTLERFTGEMNDALVAYGSFKDALFDAGIEVDPFKTLNENLTQTVVRIREINEEMGGVRERSKNRGLFGVLESNKLKALEQELSLLERRERYLRMRQRAEGGRGDASLYSAQGDGLAPSVGDILAKRAQTDAALEASKASAAKAARGISKQAQEQERYIDSLQRRLEKTKELTEVEQVLADVESGRFKGDASAVGRAIDLAEQLDLDERRNKLLEDFGDQWDAVGKAQAAVSQEAMRYFEASLTPAEKLAAELAKINELYQKGGFGPVGTEEAMEKVRRSIEAAKGSMGDLTDGAKELSEAFKDAIFQGKDLGKALEAIALKRFVFDPLSKTIDGVFESVFSAVMGGGAPAGGGSGGSGAGATLNVLSMLTKFLGFAEGGEPPVGVPYWVGERGPELRIDRRPGTIVPNHRLGQVGGGPAVSISNVIHVGAGVSPAQLVQAVNYATEKAKADIYQSMRRGGRFS